MSIYITESTTQLKNMFFLQTLAFGHFSTGMALSSIKSAAFCCISIPIEDLHQKDAPAYGGRSTKYSGQWSLDGKKNQLH